MTPIRSRLFVATGLALAMVVPARAADLVAVVNAGLNPGIEVNSSFVEKAYRGDQRFWPQTERKKIHLVMPPDSTPARTTLVKGMLHMSENDFQKFWTGKVFRGEAAWPPVQPPSVERALAIVVENPSAITILEKSQVDSLPESTTSKLRFVPFKTSA